MENLTLNELKDFCTKRGIIPEGDKRLKATWLEAAMSLKEAAIKVGETVTSPQAIEVYMTVIRFAVISCLGVIALGAHLRELIDDVEKKAAIKEAVVRVKSIAEFMMEVWLSRRALFRFLFGGGNYEYHHLYAVEPLIMEDDENYSGESS